MVNSKHRSYSWYSSEHCDIWIIFVSSWYSFWPTLYNTLRPLIYTEQLTRLSTHSLLEQVSHEGEGIRAHQLADYDDFDLVWTNELQDVHSEYWQRLCEECKLCKLQHRQT